MSNYANPDKAPARITINTLAEMKKRAEKIVMLTAYDASFAQAADLAGVEILLVGDSLGMVIQGHTTTLPVTVDDILYHTRCVTRAALRALVIADMPFMSYTDVGTAVTNAGRMLKEGGAQMVKLEGGSEQIEIVRHLAGLGIPVCAHLGLRPQSVHKLGGYRVQGRNPQQARTISDDALALQQAGADLLLLECVPSSLARAITQQLHIPVVGIGAGVHTDAQVLVLHDVLGVSFGKIPKFSKNFLAGNGSIQHALHAYVEAVKAGRFPAAEHSFE